MALRPIQRCKSNRAHRLRSAQEPDSASSGIPDLLSRSYVTFLDGSTVHGCERPRPQPLPHDHRACRDGTEQQSLGSVLASEEAHGKMAVESA